MEARMSVTGLELNTTGNLISAGSIQPLIVPPYKEPPHHHYHSNIRLNSNATGNGHCWEPCGVNWQRW